MDHPRGEPVSYGTFIYLREEAPGAGRVSAWKWFRPWRLVLSPDGPSGENSVGPVVDAPLAGRNPRTVPQVVREGVLKCL